MSHIDGELRLALAESKQNRKLVVVKPLAWATRRADPPRTAQPAHGAAGESIEVGLAKAAAEKGTDAFRAWFNSDEGKGCRATGELTPEVLARCKIIASGADELRARMAANPLPVDDPFDANPTTATDPEIEAQIMREIADRDAAMEG